MVKTEHATIHWHSQNTMQHGCNNSFTVKKIPFEFTVKLPPPLRMNKDYGFKQNGNWVFKDVLE